MVWYVTMGVVMTHMLVIQDLLKWWGVIIDQGWYTQFLFTTCWYHLLTLTWLNMFTASTPLWFQSVSTTFVSSGQFAMIQIDSNSGDGLKPPIPNCDQYPDLIKQCEGCLRHSQEKPYIYNKSRVWQLWVTFAHVFQNNSNKFKVFSANTLL